MLRKIPVPMGAGLRRRAPCAWAAAVVGLALLLAVPVLFGGWQARSSADLPASPAEVEALIAPYRDSLATKMGEVLAYCPTELRARDPEGPLGALVCDIVLARARLAVPGVAACVLNNGGLRATLDVGPITLGQVYEVMPFDNEIVVLRLAGEQVRILADQIAAAGGEPVAGLSLAIRNDRAENLLIGLPESPEPVADREYLVATSDYLADGGGNMEALWKPLGDPRRTGVLVRDALVDAFRAAGVAGDPVTPAPRAEAGTLGPASTDRLDAGRRGALPKPVMGRIRYAKGGGR